MTTANWIKQKQQLCAGATAMCICPGIGCSRCYPVNECSKCLERNSYKAAAQADWPKTLEALKIAVENLEVINKLDHDHDDIHRARYIARATVADIEAIINE